MASVIQNMTRSIREFFVISDEMKDKFKSFKDDVKTVALKIYEFLKKNRSLVFFIGSLCFSYYMAPKAAFDYLAYFGYSLKDIFIEGISFGSSLLAIANLLNLEGIPNDASDRINYLASISNVCQVYLSTTQGLISSFATAGLIASITIYRSVFEIDEKVRRLYIPDLTQIRTN